MRISVIFILFLGITAEVYADCSIDASMDENEPRIFAYGSPGAYQLWHTDTVRNGDSLQMLCPGSPAITVTCGDNNQFTPSIPIRNPPCSKTKAIAKRLSDVPGCPGFIYSVGFDVNNEFLEIYRSCYDQANIRALYTIHKTYYYGITTTRPKAKFTQQSIITGRDAATFEKRNILRRFQTLLGPQQTYITNDKEIVIIRGHMVPSADFLFTHYMRATFMYVNAMPQFQSINNGNWKKIENWIRSSSQLVAGGWSIQTGVIGILELKDRNNANVKMYLGENDTNPIPLWIYKIVSGNNANYVFLTFNNRYEAPTLDMYQGICEIVACPVGITFSNDVTSGITQCCKFSTFNYANAPIARHLKEAYESILKYIL